MDKIIANNCDLYLNKESSDVLLSIGAAVIPAHKTVLMNTSEYFNAMFSSEMIEHNLEEVRLEEEPLYGQRLMFVLRIAYGFKVTNNELKDIDFNELFDSVIIANKYHFKSVEQIVSDLFFAKLNEHSTEVLYVRRTDYSKINYRYLSSSNKENKVDNSNNCDRDKLFSIYDVLEISKSFNLDYFTELCQNYIERRSAQMINCYKYIFNLWC